MKIKVLIIEIGIKNINEIKRYLKPTFCELVYASSFLDVIDNIYTDNVNLIILSDFRGKNSTIGYIKMFQTTNPDLKLIILNNNKYCDEKYLNFFVQRGADYSVSCYDINGILKVLKNAITAMSENKETIECWSECTKKTMIFLKDNYQVENLLSFLANNINYSLSSIYHSIKNDTEKSLGCWIRQLRIKGAKRLLKSTDLPVKSVGNQIGYRSVQGFIKAFKNTTGQTPLEYRNAI